MGFVIVSSDRGLCGGLNNNLFRTVLREFDGWRTDGVESDFCVIGNKGGVFFRRLGVNLLASTSHVGDSPTIDVLIGTVKVVLDAYVEGRIDRVFFVYNQFVNSMTQRPVVEQILPRAPSEDEEVKHYWDYLYEPDAKDVLDQLLTPLRRIPGVPGRGGEHRLRAGRPHGRDEGRLRQRRRPHRRPAAPVQQGPAGVDHAGAVGDRGRGGGVVMKQQTGMLQAIALVVLMCFTAVAYAGLFKSIGKGYCTITHPVEMFFPVRHDNTCEDQHLIQQQHGGSNEGNISIVPASSHIATDTWGG